MNEIKVIKGEKMPDPKRIKHGKYPFYKMEVGDMFQIDYDRITHQSLYSAIKHYRIVHDFKAKYKIFSNKAENWIKVFRIE